jgi:hypothetical protein
MKIANWILAATALAALFTLPLAGAASRAGQEQGAWSERVQIIYQPESRSVVRAKVRVWDAEPEKHLDFVWEPGPGAALAADGTVSGEGKLIWRVRGSASYDPKTIYSLYSGEMRDGRPNGHGRLSLRSGEVLEGNFVDGRLDGSGVHVDAAGNRLEGTFKAGIPHGEGRLATTTGEIFTGSFVGGVKHGKGVTRLPGGTSYVSEWTMGKESGRPAVLADGTVGGLLKAQSGGGDAGRVEISVAVEPRMTQQATDEGGVAYEHLVREEDIAIYPADQEMRDLWNGTREVNTYSTGIFYDRDWEYAPAFVEVELGTTDGKPAKLGKLELQVASSDAYRKPMLSLVQHAGCVGFRPSFSIKNDGWGQARDMQMNLKFTGSEPGGPESRVFSRPVGSFDNGIDVAIKDVLAEAGVDTGALESKRFSCQSMDSINVCKSQVFNEVGFGEVADYIWGDDKLNTTAIGTLDYNWADDDGNIHQASEAFRIDISMAVIEVPNEAECGAGFGGSPQALRFQDVRFPIGKKDYVVDMPVRGNKNVTSYTARLKMQSDPAMSSFHTFNVAASFADGSVKKSKPVTFYFLKPRLSDFAPAPPAAACYLPEGFGSC